MLEKFFFDLPLVINLVFVFGSLYGVTRASHYLVDGAVHMAHEFDVSSLVIGATVVAVGTSSAELAINMAVVLGDGDTAAVVGNILGSNLVNFGIGLGVPALIAGLVVIPRDALERDIPLYLAATGLLTAFVHNGEISRFEAVLMLAMFVATIGLIIQYARAKTQSSVLLVEMSEIEAIAHPTAYQLTRRQALIALFGGLAALVIASRLLIFNTAAVAEELAIPEFIIGLVIIGPGTSLPEIASAIQAVRQKQAELVIGMAFGSNLFNLLFGLGLPALVVPLPIDDAAILGFTFMDIINLSLVALLLLDFGWIAKARAINRPVGAYLAATYVGFISHQVVEAAGGTFKDWLLFSVPVALLALAFAGFCLWQHSRAAASARAECRGKILCATRGGKDSQLTHEHAIRFAKEQGSEVVFLYVFDQHVLEGVATPIVINVKAQIEHMLAFLETTAQVQAQQAGVKATVIVRTGRLREQLKTVAKEEKVSSIVLGSPAGQASLFQQEAMRTLTSEIEEATGIPVILPMAPENLEF
ncbi:MAG: universal stress protein [Anaerolineae bacterium]|nr:universal stress protein [Anaerolineae bacterium]